MNEELMSEVFRAHRALYDYHQRQTDYEEATDDLVRLETIVDILCQDCYRPTVLRLKSQCWPDSGMPNACPDGL